MLQLQEHIDGFSGNLKCVCILEHSHDSIRFSETLVCKVLYSCKFKYQTRQMIQASLRISFISTVKICILYDD